MHMPAGQSGHPLSSHYRDQQPFWEQGKALPFISDVIAESFELQPINN
jgi:penicillin amidase